MSEARCGAVKNGVITLRCDQPQGHEGWHKATYSDNREITYLGAHHVTEITEHVSWEPVDHVREAVNHLFANRPPDTGAGEAERQAEVVSGDG